MNSIKLERINSAIVREVSYVLANEVKNQDIRFVTYILQQLKSLEVLAAVTVTKRIS